LKFRDYIADSSADTLSLESAKLGIIGSLRKRDKLADEVLDDIQESLAVPATTVGVLFLLAAATIGFTTFFLGRILGGRHWPGCVRKEI
jgi:hypothetical protein